MENEEIQAKPEIKLESVINETIKNLDLTIDQLKNQAKAGSCKTCQWCIPLGDQSEYHRTHLCAIQGNVTPSSLTNLR